MAAPLRPSALARDLRPLNPERIILFGSRARGRAGGGSDTDLLVIARTGKPFLRRLREAALLCRLPPPVDILVYTPEEVRRMGRESPLVARALREGRVLWSAP